MTKVVGDNLIMHVRKKLRQKFGYPQGIQMSAARAGKEKVKGSDKSKNGGNDSKKSKSKQVKEWNIPTIHTMPTGVKRGTALPPAGEGNFRKCDVAFGNSCFSTGTVGFLMASVVVNSIAGVKGRAAPTPLGFIGRMRGPVPVKGSVSESVSEVLSGVQLNGEIPLNTDSNSSSGTKGGEQSNSNESDDSSGQEMKKSNHSEKQSGRGEIITDEINTVSGVSEGLHTSTVVVDSHCHLQLDPLYRNAEDAILTAKNNKIEFAIVCGTCPGDDWDRIRILYERDPVFIVPQFGLHPWWISRYLESVQVARTDPIIPDITDIGTSKDNMKLVPSDLNTKQDPTQSIVAKAEAVELKLGSNLESNINVSWEDTLEKTLLALPHAGVGECGLDHGIKNVGMSTQIDILRNHIRIASKFNRPVTMHCVGAWALLLGVLKEMEKEERDERKRRKNAVFEKENLIGTDGEQIKGVEASCAEPFGVRAYILHSCNALPIQMAADFLKIPSVYFSFSGRALSAGKEGKLAPRIPLDRILVETDSPDQLPKYLKEKLEYNEPSLVRLNLGVLAGLMGIDANVLATHASDNSRKIFKP